MEAHVKETNAILQTYQVLPLVQHKYVFRIDLGAQMSCTKGLSIPGFKKADQFREKYPSVLSFIWGS